MATGAVVNLQRVANNLDALAPLLVAAPELLEACKYALNVLESEPANAIYSAHRELVKAAIAAAEGNVQP